MPPPPTEGDLIPDDDALTTQKAGALRRLCVSHGADEDAADEFGKGECVAWLRDRREEDRAQRAAAAARATEERAARVAACKSELLAAIQAADYREAARLKDEIEALDESTAGDGGGGTGAGGVTRRHRAQAASPAAAPAAAAEAVAASGLHVGGGKEAGMRTTAKGPLGEEMQDTVAFVPADEQLGYDITKVPLPSLNTDALGPVKYSITEEYTRNICYVLSKTTTFVDETGATTVVDTAKDNCFVRSLGIPHHSIKTMTFYDDLIVIKNEMKICCYPWQYEKYAIPKYQLVSMAVTKHDPAGGCRLPIKILFFIAGVVMFIWGIINRQTETWPHGKPVYTEGRTNREQPRATTSLNTTGVVFISVGLFLCVVSVIWICVSFCVRNYYIALQINEGNGAPASLWQTRFFGRRAAGIMRRLGRSARTVTGSKGPTTMTVGVGARPETDFIENYVYGPLSKKTEALHALSFLKHAGMMAELRVDNSSTDAVPLMAMAHQVVDAATGGANGAGPKALGERLCELQETHKPCCGCCGPSDDCVIVFHQDGIRIETATQCVPFPEGFQRRIVPKHRILGCKVQKVVGIFLHMAAFLVVTGVGMIAWISLAAAGTFRAGGISLGCGICCLGAFFFYAPFLKCVQGYFVYLDVTEKARQWTSICVKDEPDADFVFRYVYGPLAKWCGAYHCHAHLENDDLVSDPAARGDGQHAPALCGGALSPPPSPVPRPRCGASGAGPVEEPLGRCAGAAVVDDVDVDRTVP